MRIENSMRSTFFANCDRAVQKITDINTKNEIRVVSSVLKETVLFSVELTIYQYTASGVATDRDDLIPLLFSSNAWSW
eukprot:g52190.t1